MYDGLHGKGQISLCMIVRDEADCLERALLSVKGLADEVIVVDTGSRDATPQVATRLGAKLFEFPWQDDFSLARNVSLRQASREWILVLDADEAISRRDHPLVWRVVREDRHEGIYFYQRNYFEDPTAENWCVNQTDYEEGKPYTGYADVPVLRMFRNRQEIFFEGVVHESVEPSMEGMRKHYSDVPIHHFRKDASSKFSSAKRENYLRLLEKEYELNPFSLKTCFLLGRQFYELGQYPQAIAYLEQAVSLGTQSEIVYENLASAYYQCGFYTEAVSALTKVIQFNPRYSEALATMALCYYEAGEVQPAINALVLAIHLRPTSMRYHYNLAAMYYREKNREPAEAHLKEALRLAPHFSRSYYLLWFLYTEEGRDREAADVALKLSALDPELYAKGKEKIATLALKGPFSDLAGRGQEV